jgi:hypothetical protein
MTNAAVRCQAQGIGYGFVKFGELTVSAAPAGDDEYFANAFPQVSAPTRGLAAGGERGVTVSDSTGRCGS